MIANVTTHHGVTVGRIGQTASDIYVFELTPFWVWEYKGKVLPSGPFIPADRQGSAHIPQEFYVALYKAWVANEPVEFEDPFDTLEVQGA